MVVRFSLLAFSAWAAPRVVAIDCPGSSAWVHASAQVEVEASATCAEVSGEVLARVAGQPSKWHDPHNNGTYTLLSQAQGKLELQRTTGDKKYTDKMTFTLTPQGAGSGSCLIQGCSESQVTSVADFSTNYCNLRMLYCGSSEGCSPVTKTYAISKEKVTTSLGAGKDPAACLKVSDASLVSFEMPQSAESPLSSASQCIQSRCHAHGVNNKYNFTCALEQCAATMGKCTSDLACSEQMKCEERCTAVLAGPLDSTHFLAVQACAERNCPGSLFNEACLTTHCRAPLEACRTSETCRHSVGCLAGCNGLPGGEVVATALELAASPSQNLAEAMQCLGKSCPMSAETMSASPFCMLWHCSWEVAKCGVQTECREKLLCFNNCVSPLANSTAGQDFLALNSCLQGSCPAFPPSTGCAALHCAVPAAACALNSDCRQALTCANSCSTGAEEDLLAFFTTNGPVVV